jgi:hypothetical protein
MIRNIQRGIDMIYDQKAKDWIPICLEFDLKMIHHSIQTYKNKCNNWIDIISENNNGYDIRGNYSEYRNQTREYLLKIKKDIQLIEIYIRAYRDALENE